MKKVKNPKARQEAAKRMIMAMAKRKQMTKGSVAGSARVVPREERAIDDSGNPGKDLK